MGRPSGDSDDLGAEVHDFQLQRQIQELRDERDRTRKAALDGANKPAVVDDDLRWLLDKEPDGGSIAAGAAKVEQAELAEVAEHVTKQRIAYGTLKNSNLRRQRKLDALELGEMPPGFKYVVLVSHYP